MYLTEEILTDQFVYSYSVLSMTCWLSPTWGCC